MDYTFFEENYVMIIIIAVVILMAIIGFIADKQGFGSKEKTPKVKKNKKNKKEPVLENEEVTSEQPTPNMDYSDVTFNNVEPETDGVSDFNLDSNQNEENVLDNTSYNVDDSDNNDQYNMVSNQEEVENVEPSVESEIQPVVEPMSDQNVQMPEDNDVKIEETTNVEPSNEENRPVVEENESEKLDDFNLPNIDSVDKEIDDLSDDDDDVWKF